MAQVNLSDFDIPKSAKFYKVSKNIKKDLLEECTKEISKDKVGRALNRKHRTKINTINGNFAKVTSCCFKLEGPPTFLKNVGLKETKYAYLIIVEFDKYLAVFKKNCSDPFSLLKEHLSLFSSREMASYIKESNNTTCEKLSVNGMSIGTYDILRKSYEAHNLMGTLPTFNSHRLIPRIAKFSENETDYSISVNTSRISDYSGKWSIDHVIDWCFDFKERLDRNIDSNFMNQFSSSIDIKDLPAGVTPTSMIFNLNRLIENMGEKYELYYNGNLASEKTVNFVKGKAKRIYEVIKVNNHSHKLGGVDVSIVKNSKSFTLRSKRLSRFSLKNLETGNYISLLSFINTKGCFDIVFSELSYFYAGKRLYKDSNMLNNVKYITSIYEEVERFKYAKSEKGETLITRNSVDFPFSSLFYRVQEYYQRISDIIVCDDLGSQEWADHFILNKVSSGTPKITLVHSKAKSKDSHGASEMQEVVSQAVKNLGKVMLSNTDLDSKKNLWSRTYVPSIRTKNGQPKPPTVISGISRIMGSYKYNYAHFKRNVLDIVSSPSCQREVVIAVNFVRKSEIDKLVKKASEGKLTSHDTQLLWLMSSFVSSCIEVGVKPKVLCKK
ncbi:hypothetical protein [Vibrio parahaemolyticus]|uniref:hypothetical protein n=1 Tax=Vibrio parahaemolyticus TaxID=670 RepID=UPI001123845E|nr:hypothetical protein [Vibrio parahaemolyticus]TOK02402.1 hypothetical protein CGI26_23360 [Vibrio parahaemolyticus]